VCVKAEKKNYSIHIYLYSAFHNTHRFKEDLQKMHESTLDTIGSPQKADRPHYCTVGFMTVIM